MSNRKSPTTGEPSPTTEVGSIFVSNYPPYSFWNEDQVQMALEALDVPPVPDTPLGLYVHIPFCRKRCKFCYFRVYTDKDGKDVQRYLDGLAREVDLYASLAAVSGRSLAFVYFGGGTPSFISVKHLEGLVAGLQAAFSWDGVREITFECEPGTLSQPKLEAIRRTGVTRLSLGVENFDDTILAENGRAHLSQEIFRCAPWIQALDFDQVNIDLIAGMVGETDETWRHSVQQTIDMDPDSVTIYQMELPYNTVYSKDLLGNKITVPVADWNTKRAWHDEAMQMLEKAGYEVSSAYTMVKSKKTDRFLYRDSVWHGCDMVGLGVASFSHMSGVHYQNHHGWEPYLGSIEDGKLPLDRALSTSREEQATREFILQLKLGRLRPAYFQDKFGINVLERFATPLGELEQEKMLNLVGGNVELTQAGLLQVDLLLPRFYAPVHQNARYT